MKKIMNKSSSWLRWMSHIFTKNEPNNHSQLLEFLRDAQQRDLLDADSLRMIEGVLQVAQMSVSEIMIPRAEMVVIPKDATLSEILPIVNQSGHSRFPVIG